MQRDSLTAKNKLKSGVSISIKTVMIGALAIFEKYFQKEIEADPEKWEKTRQEILERGHESLDIATSHFNKYAVQFKKFFRDSEGDYFNGERRDFRTRR